MGTHHLCLAASHRNMFLKGLLHFRQSPSDCEGFAGVLDAIFMASKAPAALRKALAFRAVELVSLVSQERVPQRISEQPVEVPVSQITAACEALQVQAHAISNEIQTSLLPQLQKDIVKVAKLKSQERIQECVVEQAARECRCVAGQGGNSGSDQVSNCGCSAAAFASTAHPRTHR